MAIVESKTLSHIVFLNVSYQENEFYLNRLVWVGLPHSFLAKIEFFDGRLLRSLLN